MGVLELNRDKWKEFKAANGLSKSSFFKKADVGPTIDNFQDAVAAFNKKPSKKSLETAFKRAEDLQKAFAKFINLKEAKEELTTGARARLEKWSGQLDDVRTQLARLYNDAEQELAEADVEDLEDKFKEMFPWGK